MNTIDIMKKSVYDSLASGIMEESKLSEEALSLRGMSGKRYKHFINNLLSKQCVKKYLEIGVFEGSTAVAAAFGNEGPEYFFIDNFSLFGVRPETFINNYNRFISKEMELINDDCFAIDPLSYGIKDIDVYFYDGNHDEEDHYKALKHYYGSMSETFVFIVDDWSWHDVQKGTYRALDEIGVKIEAKYDFGVNPQGLEMKPTGIGNPNEWWCGCGVFVLSKR